MNVHALIIAGGVGARFWPRSRYRTPKQLLEIIGHGTMIQNTVYRLDPLIPKERILVITNTLQAPEIRRQLPGIPDENILVEPEGKNTAPAIAFGAEVLRKRHGADAVMVVLPADHLVHDIEAFQETLTRAIKVASLSEMLVTLGIRPTGPETGYGYIQYDEAEADNPIAELGAYPVITFAEKPHLSAAQRFIESGDFLWNSGMFIWKISTILQALAEHLPHISEEFLRLESVIDTPRFPRALDRAYREMQSISIDYGVMEKARNRCIIPSDFGWNDLGSWDEVYRMLPKDDSGNALQGNTCLRDVHHCHISATPSRIIAAIGISDLTVIDSDDALLIYRRGRSQEVKEIVDQLRKANQSSVL